MNKQFLAKSKPEETIQEHTNNLLKQFKILKGVYPDIKVRWDLLEIACFYHDLGKMNDIFQNKIRSIKNSKTEEEIPHGILSACLLDTKKLKQKYTKEEIIILYCSVYYHHHRKSIDDVDKNLIQEACKILENKREEFIFDGFNFPEKVKLQSKYSDILMVYDNLDLLNNYILLKGLLNKIDYAASSYLEEIEYKNDFLEKSLEHFMEKIRKDNSDSDWNNLQKYMKNNQDKNLIVIAQTGMGKTKAGLLWIGNGKGFFTLPIKTAINAIYNKEINDLFDNKNYQNKIGVLHSDTKSIYLDQYENKYIDNLDEYFTNTKQLSLPLTICTIDQLFTFVFLHRNYELKLATLSYSKIIIDEIQMYSSDLVAYLIRGLKMIQDIGGKYAILTATFPGFLKKLMKSNGLDFEMPEKEFVSEDIRHSVSIIRENINAEDIYEKYDNNKVLVICNTVKQCQKIYEDLDKLIKNNSDEISLNMLHAKYIRKDKEDKSNQIIENGANDNDYKGVWITSSIAEASLDIDFDILITELSEVSGLFQRFGRCYRKRIWTRQGYNCYVYDGGENLTSGIGYIIDKDIFNLSKIALRDYFENNSSLLTESDKMKLVEKTLSFENVEKTKYYKTIKEMLEYIRSILPGELDLKEAQQKFRNILSETIIPEIIYEDNKDEIESLVIKIKDQNIDIYEKMKSKEKLMSYTLDVEKNYLNIRNAKKIELNKYQNIYIIDCDYNYNLGFIRKDNCENLKEDYNFL